MMIKEFQANIERLFHQMVPVGNTTTTADTLVAILRRRATHPIRITPRTDGIQLTYYNVTIVLAHDLSLIHIIYNSDLRHTLHHIACADPHRLAGFIIALERDIPQWQHIWMNHDLLVREKMRMQQKVSNVMRTLRQQWTKTRCPMTQELRDESRIHYYNLRAHQLMLQHAIPLWRNRKTEADIVQQCLLYHITPPIEQWYEEWTTFTDECAATAAQRQRNRDEQEHAAQKLRHLVGLKATKAKILLAAIQCQHDVSISFTNNITVRKHQNTKVTCDGYYDVLLHIDDTTTRFALTYEHTDATLPHLIDGLKHINDLIPKFREALAADTQTYGTLYLNARRTHHLPIHYCSDRLKPTYYLTEYPHSNQEIPPLSFLTSYKVLGHINRIVKDLRFSIYFVDDTDA